MPYIQEAANLGGRHFNLYRCIRLGRLKCSNVPLQTRIGVPQRQNLLDIVEYVPSLDTLFDLDNVYDATFFYRPGLAHTFSLTSLSSLHRKNSSSWNLEVG